MKIFKQKDKLEPKLHKLQELLKLDSSLLIKDEF